ncbi:MAG TPA: UvrD-helicase domain-containing protein [Solirubrobacteraceae bacterium]|nr:UvrD-helicase domain-containing protein [Solirubrobacteraceae bacterium]
MTVAPELTPAEFDVCGTLPRGVTVLEASAGTGKTYTIASLAARYVAEGTPLQRLLLVTFTRIATGELRERVRLRLIEVKRGLDAAAAGASPGDDPLVALLAADGADELDGRRAALERAISDFDAATIATTHSFCQEMLGGLGIAGDLEPGLEFTEDASELVADVVGDFYVRKFRDDPQPAFGLEQAGAIAKAALATPWATVTADDGERPQLRRSLAQRVGAEVDRRKRLGGVITYDDLVARLNAALDGDNGALAIELLRRRFDVVMVDEFQDTDPDQWRILRTAFGSGDTTLVLIADPKQAIYGFRGADVYAYLDAADAATTRATLPINWRSDQGLVNALRALLQSVKLGHEGIPYRDVRAAADHQRPRLTGAPHPQPLRIRAVSRTDPAVSQTRTGFAQADSARARVVSDLVDEIVTLLQSGATIAHPSGVEAPVAPGDLAVLVRGHRQANAVRRALIDAGVPAVDYGAGSVFAGEIAEEWLTLLQSLERPADLVRARVAALTCFVGWSAQRLARAADDPDGPEWEAVHRMLHDWSRVLRLRGVAALLETIMVSQGLAARVLAGADGERRMTDLRHVGQLLHAAASADQLGTTALTAWLRSRIAQAVDDAGDEQRRRLESDAAAVQVLTIHRAKGLEFPIVFLPFLWDFGHVPDRDEPVLFHDGAGRGVTDVGLEGERFAAHRERQRSEQRGEDLRLAYVALTRARHQTVVWWAPTWYCAESPLARLLFAADEHGNVADTAGRTPEDTAVEARLVKLRERAPDVIAVEAVAPRGGPPVAWSAPPLAPGELSVSTFARELDQRWRRTSFTDITAAAYDARVGSEPEQPLIDDEPDAEQSPPAPPELAAPLSAPSLLSEMGTGVDVGTFVHRVMEATDFASAELEAELALRVGETYARRTAEIGDRERLVAGLAAAIRTPLGPVLAGRSLADIDRGDRLDELGFELPLAGGDDPSGELTLQRIADTLRAWLPADDPLGGYADRLNDAGLRRVVRGYLTGSLDLVVRIPAADAPGGHRYAVLDYKTNWLGEPGEPLTAFHYRAEALRAEMERHHYALQGLLYAVALHRYLRWRLPDYDPDTNLAGIAYLFVRGMTGGGWDCINDDEGSGVFAWRPPAGFVQTLSDVLDGQRP